MHSSLAAQLEKTFAGLPQPATDARPAKRTRKVKVTITPTQKAPPAKQTAPKPERKTPTQTSAPMPPVAEKAPHLENWEPVPAKGPSAMCGQSPITPDTRVWYGRNVILHVLGGPQTERNNEPCIEQQLDASLRLRVFGNFDRLSVLESSPVVGDMTIIARRRPNGRVFLIVDFRIVAAVRRPRYKAFIRPATAGMKHLGAKRSCYYANKYGGGIFITKHLD